MNVSNLLAEDCQIYDCFIHLPKAYQILSKMQNKSPLQVKSALLCVPGCPLLLAAGIRTGAPLLLPLVFYVSVYSQDNPFPSPRPCHIYWSPFGRLFPELSCKSMDPSQRSQEAFLPVIVYVPRRPLPHIIICCKPLWSSSCLLPPFFPGSDSVLFLLEPSAYICCLLF